MKRMTILSKILCLVLLVTTIIFSMPINASEPNIYEVETIANQDNYEKYLSDSEKAIELFGDFNQTYVFCSTDLNDRFDFNFDANVLGVTLGKKIYIDTNFYNKNVVLHETLHAYDFYRGRISESKEFLEIYKKNSDKVSVTEGNNENTYEFFASCGEMYFNSPQKLKLNCIDAYIFFNNEFN